MTRAVDRAVLRAELGVKEAHFSLGVMFEAGTEVEKDTAKAFRRPAILELSQPSTPMSATPASVFQISVNSMSMTPLRSMDRNNEGSPPRDIDKNGSCSLDVRDASLLRSWVIFSTVYLQLRFIYFLHDSIIPWKTH